MPSSIDPAVLRSLSATLPDLDPSTAKISTHGGSGFASTYRITTPQSSIFVKTSNSKGAATMFEGEDASLNALHTAVPSLAPQSFAWGKLDSGGGYFLATEFLDMSGSSRSASSSSGTSLAEKLANLHTAPVPKDIEGKGFGFPVPTCCGDTEQDNSWKPTWAQFFSENRLNHILTCAETNNGPDPAIRELIEKVRSTVIPALLSDTHLGGSSGPIQPRIVHGDLWSGNKGNGSFLGRSPSSTSTSKPSSEPVIFDPSSSYAHHEFEHGIMNMFGGFGAAFWKEYFALCPKTEPVEEYDDRVRLYEAYHHLNHYAIFGGGGYKSGAVGLLRPLVKKYG